MAALPDLHQRELRPYRSWNWRTHSSVSVSNNSFAFLSHREFYTIKFNPLIFLRFIIFQCIHFPRLQCLRTRRAFGRNRLPLRPPLGVLRHLGDGAAKAGACHRHLRPHLGHPDSVVFPALSEVGLKFKKKKKCGCHHTTSPENHVPCSHFTKTDLVFNLCRFKEHVQSNNPKHFLSEEEFVQLRQELSKASLAQMGGEQDETPAVQEDLPPGTEDLSDPAKVQIQFQVLQEILTFWASCLQGLSEACRFLVFSFFFLPKEGLFRSWGFSLLLEPRHRQSFHTVQESNTCPLDPRSCSQLLIYGGLTPCPPTGLTKLVLI